MAADTRVIANEARFAAANDAIAAIATTLLPRSYVPFLCECPDPRCTAIAPLSLGEYASVRLLANRFVLSSRCSDTEPSSSLVVERCDRYTVVDRL